jgi:uncharacterized protein (TIGR02145 family)
MKSINLITNLVLIAIIIFSSCSDKSENEILDVVTIGDQVWMSKNLDVSKFRNGDLIPQAKTEEEWNAALTNLQPVWCYYKYLSTIGAKYGKLYNGYAVVDARGLAPIGFHIPTDTDWTRLTDYLGSNDETGTKMKSTSGWYRNGNGTNSSGFAALPGGVRFHGAPWFLYDEQYCYFWSSTASVSTTGNIYLKMLYLTYQNGSVMTEPEYIKSGMSVRCIKD